MQGNNKSFPALMCCYRDSTKLTEGRDAAMRA